MFSAGLLRFALRRTVSAVAFVKLGVRGHYIYDSERGYVSYGIIWLPLRFPASSTRDRPAKVVDDFEDTAEDTQRVLLLV
jgi:hypothetical protein